MTITEFAKGDTVRRTGISYPWEGMHHGHEYIVDRQVGPTLFLEGYHREYAARAFELVRSA